MRTLLPKSLAAIATVGSLAGFRHKLSAKEADRPPTSTADVVVVGGGTAGVSVAAQLKRKDPSMDIVIYDASEKHYYQPGWTLVGALVRSFQWTEEDMAKMIPHGVRWVKRNVTSFDPDTNKVVDSNGTAITYNQLVVAPGMSLKWDAIPGLKEAIFAPDGSVRTDSPVVSNYAGGHNTAAALQRFPDGGTALFTTQPGIKCGGAPIKAALLSWDFLTNTRKIQPKAVEYLTPGGNVFPVARYTAAIEELFAKRNVKIVTGASLTNVKVHTKTDGPAGVATFMIKKGDASETVQKEFDLLHAVPPMGPPKVVAESKLADESGYVAVHKHTLQHTRYRNVWSLGDASSVPTSKTAAAVMAQAPVLVHNLLTVRGSNNADEDLCGKLANYNGYTSCPLAFSLNPRALLLMEFGFGGVPMESFPWDPRKADGTLRGRFAWYLKERGFPAAYWHLMPRGRWYGANGPKEPAPCYHLKEQQ